ncbi:TonB-dependent receptor [Eilatimonas milleporae]|nr:TonB-dependent receptor [Eilatimonas milleporae]
MPATAQQADSAQDTTSGTSEVFRIDEITVTARRRAESLQRTPVSVTAIGGEDLVVRSIDSFNELANAAPSLDINGGIPNGGGSATQIFLRGVGQNDYAFPNEPGVGLYIDDVYISRTAGGDFGFMDIERIEVLRGPQATLYGKNTIGGAVKVITRQPEGDTRGEFGVTVGRFERLDFYGNVEFPLSDTVFAKISGAQRTRDGLGTNLIEQDLGNEDEATIRGVVRWVPNASWDVSLTSDYLRQRQNGPAGSMVHFERNDANAGGIDLINSLLVQDEIARFGLEPPFDQYGDAFVKTLEEDGKDVYNSFGTVETRDWADIFGVSLNAVWTGDNVTVTSVTSHRRYDIDIRRDSEHTPFDIVRVDNPENTRQFSQEVRVSGLSFDEKLNWVVGAFGIHDWGTGELFAPLLSGLFEATGGLADNTAFITSEIEAYSLAVFGEGTYYFTPDFGLTLGGRLAYDDKTYNYGLSRPESGQVPLPPEDLVADWTEFLPKAAVEYTPSDDLLLYASASKGYKAGGFNARALSGIAPQPYDPEFIWAYEAGFKASLADGRVTINGAGFYNDYTDIQLLAVLNLGGGNVETVIENAGEGRIIGGELEITARPTPNLLLNAGLSYLDTEYTDIDPDAENAGITENNEFINAPEWILLLGGEYTIDLKNGGNILLRGDATYKTEQFRDAVNTPQLLADAYWNVNSRIAYQDPSGNYEIAFFVTNLTDEVYITNGVEVLGLGYVEAYYSRPREWGLSALARF